MRLPDWKTCAGYLAVIAALALSLPGVRAVRADEEVAVISVNLVDSAPSCDPSSESGNFEISRGVLGGRPRSIRWLRIRSRSTTRAIATDRPVSIPRRADSSNADR